MDSDLGNYVDFISEVDFSGSGTGFCPAARRQTQILVPPTAQPFPAGRRFAGFGFSAFFCPPGHLPGGGSGCSGQHPAVQQTLSEPVAVVQRAKEIIPAAPFHPSFDPESPPAGTCTASPLFSWMDCGGMPPAQFSAGNGRKICARTDCPKNFEKGLDKYILLR